MDVLNLKNLFVYILYADQDIVEDRIMKRKYNENQILGKKQKYETLKRLEISKKSDYKKIYDSLIFFLKEKNIKHIIINTNNYNYKEITND